jgi:hypothetical protein
MKQFFLNLKWLPEFYFIMVSVLWFYLSVNIQHSNNVNFPAIILIVLFHMQLFMNDQKFGKVLAGIVAIGTFVLLYVLSQRLLSSMQFDQDSQIFTLEIGNLIIVNFIMAFLMYRKNNIFKIASEE